VNEITAKPSPDGSPQKDFVDSMGFIYSCGGSEKMKFAGTISDLSSLQCDVDLG
jgi:hypothetical protein